MRNREKGRNLRKLVGSRVVGSQDNPATYGRRGVFRLNSSRTQEAEVGSEVRSHKYWDFLVVYWLGH